MYLKEKMKNMKVRKKLSVYGAIMITMMIIMVVVALWEAQKMNVKVKEITEVWSPSVSHVQTMDTLTSNYRMKQYGHLVSTTAADMAGYDKELADIEQELSVVQEEFSNLITTDGEKKLYKELEEKWNTYVTQSQEIIELSRAGKTEEGGEYMVGGIYTTFKDFQGVFNELKELEMKELDRAKQAVANAYNTMVVSIITILIVGIVLSIGIASVVIKLISDPIRQITEASQMMRQGELSGAKILTYESKDELGVVAESLGGAMNTLNAYVNEISDTLREMAKGDLTKDGNEITEFLGDFESIKESFVYILKKFNATLTDIQDTSAQVATSSGQIADSSQALSGGATEQAGAIAEVTTSLSKIVELSDESAKEAQEAYDQIKLSVENAENGRRKMEELTEEMKRIMEISKKIENISTTIEDIASQTNILSLNASVEAARAGEAGKGFAVVAEQIGKLASDSAQSAVDTRELIGKALEEIKNGNIITTETSEAFRTMIRDMQSFAEATHRTTENAKTEAQALEQVGERIDMISSEIQNTAATSEENSAISESLSEEAETLNNLVKRFKLY